MKTGLDKSSNEQPINDQSMSHPPAIWNPYVAGNWSIFFTPIFGSSLVLLNWKTLGVEEIRGSQIWLIISILMFFSAIWSRRFAIEAFIPYFLVWYFASARPQAKYVEKRWQKEYPKKGWLYPLLLGCAGFIAVFILSTIVRFILG